MNVRLVIERGRNRKVFTLQGHEAVLGRGRGNALRIPSAEVSRRHCRLRLQEGVVTVEDLDSVNGTYLNGLPVRNEETVRPGDRLQIGPVTFVVEYDLTPRALEDLRRRVEGRQDGLLDLDELQQLDDLGEVPELEELAVVEELEEVEEVQELQLLDEPEQVEEVGLAFEAQPWQMPEGGDLRDLLAQMEEEAGPPTTRRRGPPEPPRRDDRKRRND
jgi:pSer/pThr/pTyr-binding forkhead associated (FHA) protein